MWTGQTLHTPKPESKPYSSPSTATPWAAERNGCPHVAGACL
nr:MAG TPA: hypothetical protein [Caudoviricetes sp.]